LKSQHFLFGSGRFIQFCCHPSMQDFCVRNHFNNQGDILGRGT
jgi:hypothetical protein